MTALATKPLIRRTPTGLWAVRIEWVGGTHFTMHFREWRVARDVALSYVGRPS